MNKEAKSNLIFGLILVALLTPGAILLFRKKLDPAAQPMYLPDALQQQAAYMDWVQENPAVRRLIPPQTSIWIHELALQRWTDQSPPPPRWQQGQISANRRFEVLAIQRLSARQWTLGMLVWDMETLPPETRWFMGEEEMRIANWETIDLPRQIRRELRDLGFVRPPRTIAYFQLSTPAPGNAADSTSGTFPAPANAAASSPVRTPGDGPASASAAEAPPPALKARVNQAVVDRWTWDSADYPWERELAATTPASQPSSASKP